ncbi:MAG: glutathione S-transferase N-terminal domain-containing protein [Rhodospirillales bacterium]|nr:glutathione S-transferase N-terminal domain-containing protein [Alphaproteobacteria bacterium]MBL6948043.1 glutathione S-transferase N-terminal domain-containing protein [Rhodospirillales bacterium]
MKLRFSPASPYVRKVSVTLVETGLDDNVEKVLTNVWDEKTDIGNVNPLGKVPTLILEDGQVLYDSPVICEYLDSLHDGDKLFPASGAERWKALRLQALGDGMTDAGIAWLLETRRPEEFRYDKWIGRQTAVVLRAMDALENNLENLGTGFGIGQIAVACSLGWLDFRFPDLGWRDDRPGLADWFTTVSDRPSMEKTAPAEA